MEKENQEQLHKRNMLRNYLKRYRKAENNVEILRRRRNNLIEDMKYPLGTQNISSLPNNNEPGAGAASYIFRQSELEERIYAQECEAKKIMLQIMDIMDFLPAESENRSVLELKYIDGHSDKDIIKIKFYSNRSTLSYHLANGLDELLQFAKVQKIIEEFDESDLTEESE